MPKIQPRTIACTDQIMAWLFDVGPERYVTTKEVMEALHGQEGTSYISQILRREEAAGRVISMKPGPNGNSPVLWRMSDEYWQYMYQGRRVEDYTLPEDFDAPQD